MDLRQAKRKAIKAFIGIPGVEGIGRGDGVLRIYILDPAVREQLPETFEGFALQVIVTGPVVSFF